MKDETITRQIRWESGIVRDNSGDIDELQSSKVTTEVTFQVKPLAGQWFFFAEFCWRKKGKPDTAFEGNSLHGVGAMPFDWVVGQINALRSLEDIADACGVGYIFRQSTR